MSLLTIGHYNHPQDDFIELLTRNSVEVLADTRGVPGSRRSPWFGPTMAEWIGAAGMEYWHMKDLGGRRREPPALLPSDSWWENEQFRNYAAWTRTSRFLSAYRELCNKAASLRVAVMCGEPMWWRCHRRLIADVATNDGLIVHHIMPTGGTVTHPLSGWGELVSSDAARARQLERLVDGGLS